MREHRVQHALKMASCARLQSTIYLVNLMHICVPTCACKDPVCIHTESALLAKLGSPMLQPGYGVTAVALAQEYTNQGNLSENMPSDVRYRSSESRLESADKSQRSHVGGGDGRLQKIRPDRNLWKLSYILDCMTCEIICCCTRIVRRLFAKRLISSIVT